MFFISVSQALKLAGKKVIVHRVASYVIYDFDYCKVSDGQRRRERYFSSRDKKVMS